MYMHHESLEDIGYVNREARKQEARVLHAFSIIFRRRLRYTEQEFTLECFRVG